MTHRTSVLSAADLTLAAAVAAARPYTACVRGGDPSTANDNEPAPVPGLRATIQVGYVMLPCTVLAVSKSGHKLTLRHDAYDVVARDYLRAGDVLTPREDLQGEVIHAFRDKWGVYRNRETGRVLLGVWRAER